MGAVRFAPTNVGDPNVKNAVVVRYANTNARDPIAKNVVVVRSAPTTAFDQNVLNAPAPTSANTTASDPNAEYASRRTEMQSKDTNNRGDVTRPRSCCCSCCYLYKTFQQPLSSKDCSRNYSYASLFYHTIHSTI